MKRGTEIKAFILLFVSVVSLVILSGCVVQSINPFYAADAVIDLPEVSGTWVLKKSSVDEGLNREWTFSADKIALPDAKGGSFVLSSRFFRIGDMLFLDAIADSPPDGLSFWWVLHVTPVHTVSRVIADNQQMKIIPLNASWMEAAVKQKTVVLSAVRHPEQNSYLFTATSADWAEFLRKYGKDQNVFPEKDAFVFARP